MCFEKIFPDELKITAVISIFKKNNPNDKTNFQ